MLRSLNTIYFIPDSPIKYVHNFALKRFSAILKMTTYTCAEEDITEVKERSVGGGHWGDKGKKVDHIRIQVIPVSFLCFYLQ